MVLKLSHCSEDSCLTLRCSLSSVKDQSCFSNFSVTLATWRSGSNADFDSVGPGKDPRFCISKRAPRCWYQGCWSLDSVWVASLLSIVYAYVKNTATYKLHPDLCKNHFPPSSLGITCYCLRTLYKQKQHSTYERLPSKQ